MHTKLGTSIALISITAMLLVGCTPEEPGETASPTTVTDEVTATFDGFYQAVDAQYAAGEASVEGLSEYATDAMAVTWAADVQSTIDAGRMSRGVLRITAVEIVSETQGAIQARLCTDGSGIETTHQDGSTQAPSGLVAWAAGFERAGQGSRLLLDDLQPIADTGICGG